MNLDDSINYKLYYKCPLKAAYMAKEFGVRLYVYPSQEAIEEFGDDQPFDWEDLTGFYSYQEIASLGEALSWIRYISPEKIYVTKNDYNIFTIQPEDMVSCIRTKNDHTQLLIMTGKAFWSDDYYKKVKKPEIIMRNDKQFFHPEIETIAGEEE